MGVKPLVLLVMVIILTSACSIGKTKPVVTDLNGVQKEPVKEEPEVVIVKPKEVIVEKEEEIIEEPEVVNETEELPPGTHLVLIKDLKFDPQELTIKKGETVRWKHEDTYEEEEETRHYVAAHNNEFRSPIFYFGQTFEHTFESEGTFTYIDVIYKDRAAMKGTIIVE